MTTIAEIDRQIAALQAQKAELEKQWPHWLEDGHKVLVLEQSGGITERRWDNDAKDKAMMQRGLVFDYYNKNGWEAARRDDKKRIVTQKLRDIRGDWKVETWNISQERWVIYFEPFRKEWQTNEATHGYYIANAEYFNTKKAAERAIALGDELNCLLED